MCIWPDKNPLSIDAWQLIYTIRAHVEPIHNSIVINAFWIICVVVVWWCESSIVFFLFELLVRNANAKFDTWRWFGVFNPNRFDETFRLSSTKLWILRTYVDGRRTPSIWNETKRRKKLKLSNENQCSTKNYGEKSEFSTFKEVHTNRKSKKKTFKCELIWFFFFFFFTQLYFVDSYSVSYSYTTINVSRWFRHFNNTFVYELSRHLKFEND